MYILYYIYVYTVLVAAAVILAILVVVLVAEAVALALYTGLVRDITRYFSSRRRDREFVYKRNICARHYTTLKHGFIFI